MRLYSVLIIAITASICLFLGSSCGSGTQDATLNLLADQVMEVHDEVMPKMGTIHQLKKKLSDKSALLLETEEENQSEMLKAVAEHQTALEAAEDQMMGWMHSFDKDWASKKPEEAKLYLQGEKKRIAEVKESMLSAIASAEEFLAQ